MILAILLAVILFLFLMYIYIQGIGSKLLKRSGWTAGRGVGVTNQGITEPVESDGQLPYIKRGFG